MRNMKKFLALVLAMLMVCSMAVMTTSAAEEGDYTEAAQTLAALKVMKGNENGDLMMEAGVTRYQTALFFAQAVTGKTDAAVWNAEKKSANFADVIDYGTAIDYVAGLNIVKGRGNGVYGYNDPIIYQDMIVMAIRALGYETADMQYPYGHILAAQKLELLTGIDLVNYKAELKRGETAQLIWNMLRTEVAVVDPLTDKVIYPGEEDASLAGAISSTLAAQLKDRKTLLEESKFASATLDAVIVEFVAADEDEEDSVDTVYVDYTYTVDEVEYTVEDVAIAAADLGITADTPKIAYLGLPVTLFVDCAAADFDTDYADEEATVVFASFEEYTTVTNVNGETNIRYVVADNNINSDKTYVSLGGVKFTNKDYEGELLLWDDAKGWVRQNQAAWADLASTFLYTTKDGYVGAGNTYGEVSYRVIEKEDDKSTVEVLYVPYEFGQYLTRELPSSATGKDETFSLYAKYTGEDSYVDVDKNTVDFTEYFFGTKTYEVTATKVSKTKGEASLNLTIEGETVQSGDFMFYHYNAMDNILTVAQNCGTFATGRLTGTSNKVNKETVTINGTKMGIGFDGLYTLATAVYDETLVNDIIDTLKPGKDNVKYIAVDGNIVYMTNFQGEADASSYSFAVLSAAEETIKDVLDLTDSQYNKALVDDLYVEDGYVVVAGLDVTTGAWAPVKIEYVALDYADQDESADEDYDFTHYVDVATMAKYTEITTQLAGATEYGRAKTLLAEGGLYMVVEAEDGVYTIADIDTTNDGAAKNANNKYLVTRSAIANTLTFNDSGRTNAITADDEVDAARVTTVEGTVVVVIGDDTIEVRTGAMAAKNSLDKKPVAGVESAWVTDATFFAADASLIVLTTGEDVDGWGKGSTIAGDDTYFIVMPEFTTEYGTTENEDELSLTIEGLFDLKTMEMADPIVVIDDETDVKALNNALACGDYYMLVDGEFKAADKTYAAALEAIYGDDDFVEDVISAWDDHESITVGTASVNDPQNSIDVTVITLNLLEDVDLEDYDLDDMYIAQAYDETDVKNNKWDVVGVDVITTPDNPATEEDETAYTEYYAYELDLTETVVELEAPMAGVLANFEIAKAGTNVNVYNVEAEVYEELFTVEYYTVAVVDEKADTVAAYVLKLIVPAVIAD